MSGKMCIWKQNRIEGIEMANDLASNSSAVFLWCNGLHRTQVHGIPGRKLHFTRIADQAQYSEIMKGSNLILLDLHVFKVRNGYFKLSKNVKMIANPQLAISFASTQTHSFHDKIFHDPMTNLTQCGKSIPMSFKSLQLKLNNQLHNFNKSTKKTKKFIFHFFFQSPKDDKRVTQTHKKKIRINKLLLF